MPGRHPIRPAAPILLSAAAALATCIGPTPPARSQQVLIPNQMHRSLTVELHSVRDDVELFSGDPQYLLQLYLRPVGSMPPKIDFSNTGQVAILRVLDLSLFEPGQLPEEAVTEEDAALLEELRQEQERDNRQPFAQNWDLELMPAAPTEFVLRCQAGKAVFDFTDLQVQEVHLVTDSTAVRVDFERPNPIAMRRFKLTATAGRLELRQFLNARSRLTTLQVPDAACDLDFTGEPFEGESEIFVEGVPHDIRIVVPRRVGVRIDGPSITVARFDAGHMQRVDLALASQGYETQPCRLHIYFNRLLPNLKVEWQE
jgi:hypothetical protein